MKPNLVLDKHDRVWRYDQWGELYKCISVPSLNSQSLEDLVVKCAPIRILEQGDIVKLPYKPIAEGRWVEIDCGPDAESMLGRVKSYDEGKLFYEIIVNIPRGAVKEAP